jgi:hypothetical protein
MKNIKRVTPEEVMERLGFNNVDSLYSLEENKKYDFREMPDKQKFLNGELGNN